MEIKKTHAPHIRTKEDATAMMKDVAFALVFLVIMSVWYYQMRALVVVGVSVLTCYITDTICLAVQNKKRGGNISPLITGMIIALMMPATIPYYVVIVADIFAILIAKHPFGGLGNNIFNPSCAGIAFAIVCWESLVLRYPQSTAFLSEGLPIFGKIDVPLTEGPLSYLRSNGMPKESLLELLIGNFQGPMGTTCILVIILCALFLIYRRVISWHIPVSFLAAAAAVVAFIPRTQAKTLQLIGVELFVGAIMFAAVFMASDPVTSPSLPGAKLVYGAGCGILSMLFRYYGRYSEGVVFAILIMNALSGMLDHIFLGIKTGNSVLARYRRSKEAYKNSDEYKEFLVNIEKVKDQRDAQFIIEETKKAEKRAKNAKEKADRDKERAEKRAADAIIRAEEARVRAEEKAKQDKLRAEEKARQDKLKAEQKAEQEKLKAEERARQEKLKAEQKAEQEKLKAEAVAKEAAEKLEREKQEAKEKAELEKLELEKANQTETDNINKESDKKETTPSAETKPSEKQGIDTVTAKVEEKPDEKAEVPVEKAEPKKEETKGKVTSPKAEKPKQKDFPTTAFTLDLDKAQKLIEEDEKDGK